MLSYQHSYHAGNLADVHKHSVLAAALAYMVQKDKPLTYLETHSGRGIYDLQSAESIKTGEAESGILCPEVQEWFSPASPYRQVIARTRQRFGASAYPGSPWVASEIMRPQDSLHLAERHPLEVNCLKEHLSHRAQIYPEDGFSVAERLCPPSPRRGVMMVDPSYELESDYSGMPPFIYSIAKKWNVGVIFLWYPILVGGRHEAMADALGTALPRGCHHQVKFRVAREGHRMIGSGLYTINAPYGLQEELARLSECFLSLGA